MRLALIWTILLCLCLAVQPAQAKKKYTWHTTQNSTAYCLQGDLAMQKKGGGAYRAHKGIVASNSMPLGTRIRLTKPVFGRYIWVVRDRIGWGTDLDFWTPSCSQALKYGRRPAKWRIIK